jgi:hypothetical protein
MSRGSFVDLSYEEIGDHVIAVLERRLADMEAELARLGVSTV